MSNIQPDLETSSAKYAERFAGEAGAYLLARQSELIVEALTALPSAFSVLDVGGGHGQVLRAVREDAALRDRVTVFGVGTSPYANEMWRRAAPKEPGRFVASVLSKLPFPDRSVDVVCAVRLLTHVSDWRVLCEELCRVARMAVIVDYPPLLSANLAYPVLFALKRAIERSTRTFALFTHLEIESTFSSAGFEVRSRHGQFFFPMVLHRAIKNPRLSHFLEAIPRRAMLTRTFGNPVIARFERVRQSAG